MVTLADINQFLNMISRILIVDDEEDICNILKFNLTKEGFEVRTASSAEEALTFDIKSFNLILLDVMMGGMSGFEMASKLKESPATAALPIVFITARDTENDAVEGFELGADDYIAKPFSIREVVSRVKAVLRRTAGAVRSSAIEIDDTKKTVSLDGEPSSLTRTEYEILRLLYNSPGKVFSREEILAKAWPGDVIVTDRTVDVNITRLRKKLGAYGDRIVSRHGFGYLYEEK